MTTNLLHTGAMHIKNIRPEKGRRSPWLLQNWEQTCKQNFWTTQERGSPGFFGKLGLNTYTRLAVRRGAEDTRASMVLGTYTKINTLVRQNGGEPNGGAPNGGEPNGGEPNGFVETGGIQGHKVIGEEIGRRGVGAWSSSIPGACTWTMLSGVE
jgi:hypothetical protein